MKININQIPPEGLALEEVIDPEELGIDTEFIKFRKPVRVKAKILKITDTVIADIRLEVPMQIICSCCLEESGRDFCKDIKLSYPLDKAQHVIDFNQDIREDIILEYPIKPLCKPDCRGLCFKCGKNLNQGGCSCGPS